MYPHHMHKDLTQLTQESIHILPQEVHKLQLIFKNESNSRTFKIQYFL